MARDLEIQSWARAEIFPWAHAGLSWENYSSQIVQQAGLSLSRFILIPTVSKLIIDDCNPVDLDEPTKNIINARFRPRAEKFARLVSKALISLQIPILVDVADQCTDSREFPIFSFQKEEESKIILLPDIDFLENDFYLNDPTDTVEYDRKKTAAVFAGSTTGGGLIDVQKLSDNSVERIRSARFFKKTVDVSYYLPNIIHCTEDARRQLVEEGFGDGKTFDWNSQVENKFILSQDGHGATCSRIFRSLSSNSVLLKYNSIHTLFYFRSLKPWVHYIPITSDNAVLEIIDVEKRYPGYFSPIAKAGQNFAAEMLTIDCVKFYTFSVIEMLKRCFYPKDFTTDPQSISSLDRKDRAIMKINRIEIDSSHSRTELCEQGAELGTDKSPYSMKAVHRHPYTAVYSLLFQMLKDKPIIFGEIGILDNASMKMWRRFFTRAELFGFEYSDEHIAAAEADNLPNTTYIRTDITDKELLLQSFRKSASMFDILIDDSTHLFDHQILFVDAAVDFVKPGGLVIVEDVFRGWSEERYAAALEDQLQFFSSATFIDANHSEGFSGGTVEPYFNNDKILVLQRNALVRKVPERSKQSEQLKVFMATHKPYQAPNDPVYLAVQAGAQVGDDFGLLKDSEGHSISEKNPHYSEMTVQYWIWKNVDAPFVGLMHYRRFFKPKYDAIFYRDKAIASGHDLISDLQEHDMLVIEPIDLYQPGTTIRYSVEDQYVFCHGFDLLTARKVISDCSPEYIEAFDAVMRNCKLIPYNLNVARREVFNAYSGWIFPILFEIEQRVQIKSVGAYQGRVLAFLSERLFTTWIVHNRNSLRLSFRSLVFFENI